jgi:hypothetical protein
VYARDPPGTPEYPEALYRQALLAEQRRSVPEARAMLEQLRNLPEKKNDFRAAALIKLSEYYEGEAAPAPKLKALYEDLLSATKDPEVAKQAGLRLKELQ